MGPAPARGAGRLRRWPGCSTPGDARLNLGIWSSQRQGRTEDHHRDVHLSDGGHFENLAFYELVRRHCRYIIVSDCGADPGVAFDDLGNALRRIREDFGVTSRWTSSRSAGCQREDHASTSPSAPSTTQTRTRHPPVREAVGDR